MATTINKALSPGFVLQVQQGSLPTLLCTVYDRAGNVIDLTGYALKFAIKNVAVESNGLGKLVFKERVLFDALATIVSATEGNISIALTGSVTGLAKTFPASLRIWDTTSTDRIPTDAYSGSLQVDPGVVRVES